MVPNQGVWIRKWQPTPVFLPGKSHGQWSLAVYSLWGHKESDMTERRNQLNQPIMVSSGPCSLMALEEDSLSLASFWWLPAILDTVLKTFIVTGCAPVWLFPRVIVSVYFFFPKKTQEFGVGPTIIQYDFIFNYIFKYPVSKGHRFWVVMNIWGTISNPVHNL